jgi:hypothetical protein
MKPGLTVSCIGHAAALLFAVLTISAQPMQAPPPESLPVDFISETDFSKLTQGVKNAPKQKTDAPKPLADKVGELKSVDQLAPNVADKQSITTDTSANKTEPKPQQKPDTKAAAAPDQKPQSKPDNKAAAPESTPADNAPATKTPELNLGQIAELLKKDAAKKPAKAEDKPQPPKPPHDAPKFDANQVAALLDKRAPRRQLASAETLNDTANIGAATGQAAQLSQSEIDALRARLSQCWNPPAGVDVNSNIYVVLRVLFRPDGSLAQEPVVVEGTASTLGPALAASAKRALLMCQPFTMLRPQHYDQWKDIEVKFDPHELLGG